MKANRCDRQHPHVAHQQQLGLAILVPLTIPSEVILVQIFVMFRVLGLRPAPHPRM
jgi:hypothetical protein